jgi:hypothetical protein
MTRTLGVSLLGPNAVLFAADHDANLIEEFWFVQCGCGRYRFRDGNSDFVATAPKLKPN